MFVCQTSALACALPFVAMRRPDTASSDARWVRLPLEIWTCSLSIWSARPDWRAISRVMRLPVALIMIRAFLERRQQRLHGFARDLDRARGGRIGLLKAEQVARFPVEVDLARKRAVKGKRG